MSLATAILTGDVAELPGKRNEDWRWTDLRGLIRAVPSASPVYDGLLEDGPFGPSEALLVVNGHGPDHLHVRDDRTTALRFVSKTDGTAHVARMAIEVDAGRSLTLLESYEGQGVGYVASAELDIRLGEGARLERIVIADDDSDAVSVSQARVTLSTGAVYEQTVLTSGAKRQRIETQLVHPGHGAAVRLDGAYLVSAKHHADITTIVSHEGVDGATTQLTKGVVRDQARGIFQGRIIVAEGADRTDARMGHHALILSERAEVDAKPELLIYADDVQCAHGNTIGALDEDAIFYARQRGIPDDQARAMLTEAFIGEVIDRIGHEGAREVARAWAQERLR